MSGPQAQLGQAWGEKQGKPSKYRQFIKRQVQATGED